MTGFEAGDIVSKRHWRRFGKGFPDAASFISAVRAELRRAGVDPVRASYDEAGNCVVCGESGRCPGWHDAGEVRIAKMNPRGGPTPGEWRAVKTLNDAGTRYEEEVWDVESDSGVSVAECGATKYPQSEADARLISASKELRKALEMLMASEGGEPRKGDPESVRIWHYAACAIDKSEGLEKRRR